MFKNDTIHQDNLLMIVQGKLPFGCEGKGGKSSTGEGEAGKVE